MSKRVWKAEPLDEWDKDGVRLHKLVRIDGLNPFDAVTKARIQKELTATWTFEEPTPDEKPLWQWSEMAVEAFAMSSQTAKDNAKAAFFLQSADKALAARGQSLMKQASAKTSAKTSAKIDWWLE
mgnify:CR=1 FL=1